MQRIVYGLVALVATVLVVACGGSDNKSGSSSSSTSTSSKSAQCQPNTSNASATGSVKIGSKPFAEQELLATITKQVLEKNGFKVDYTTKAADPAIDQALRSGNIDLLWQYTGTELQQFLNVDKPPT